MSKKNLLAKRVLTALALGSVLYAPVAMAKDVNVADNQTITGTIYGGDTSSSNILNVNLLGEHSIVYQIVGGFNNAGGNANNNTLAITGKGTVLGGYISDGKGGYKYDDAVFGGWVYSNKAGTASNNTVIINGVIVNEEIYGGAIWMDYDDEDSENWNEQQKAEFVEAYNAYPGGTASKNEVTIESGTVDEEIFGANIYKGTAESNSVIIENGTISDKAVYGAYLGSGTAVKNTVNVKGGEFSSNDTMEIYGAGFCFDFAWPDVKNIAKENVVAIEGGTHTISPVDDDEMNVIVGAGYEVGETTGVTGAGTFSKNGVNISGGSFNFKQGAELFIFGAMGKADAVSENFVNITGGEFVGQVGDFQIYGGYSKGGAVTGNSVSVDGCTITSADHYQNSGNEILIVGGAVENVSGEKSPSSASNNVVTIGKNVTTNGYKDGNNDTRHKIDVIGGLIVYGNANGNQVTVKSGSFNDIIGGEVYYEIEGEGDAPDKEFGKGDVYKNIVRVSTTGTYEDVIGGETIEGDATYNEVHISAGTSKEQEGGDHEPPAIAGGMSWKGNAEHNTVEITGGNFDATVDGGLAGGNANNNTVSFSNATMKILNLRSEETGIGIAGGWGIIEKDDATALTDAKKQITANGNIVTVSKATVGSATPGEVATDMYIVGGAVTTEASELLEDQKGYQGPKSFKNNNDLVGTASGNTVTIENGSKIYVDIFGGVLDGGQGTVSNNSVIIKGSTVYGTIDKAGENAIYGGYVEYGNPTGSEVTGNSVSITNSTIEVDVYGGYADNGKVTGNSVSIVNSTVKNGAEIYGGYVDGDGVGEEKNNSVSLDGVIFVGDGTGNDETRIYGGRHEGGSGNSLHIGVGGFKVSEKTNVTIKRFDAMTFADGAVVTNNGDLTFEECGGKIIWNPQIIGSGTVYAEEDIALNAKVENNLVVANGRQVTVNADMKAAQIDLNNATITMASGTHLTVTTALNMTGANTEVTLDKDNVLNNELVVKSGLGSIINGEAGELALRFNGAEYTATQHKTAKDALFGTGEKAVLTFAGGVLKIDEKNETLGIQGQKNGNEVTMSGVQPTVYDKSGGEVEPVGAQEDKTVGIIDNTGALETADKVSLADSSNVTAKDLQIKEVATAGQAFAIEVKDGSKLNLTGGDNVLVKNENGQQVKVDLKAETGAIITLGNENKQVVNGMANVNELDVAGTVNVYNMGLNIEKLTVNGGKVVFDPSYNKIAELEFISGTVQVVNDGTVVNVGMDKDALKAALDSAGLATTASNDGYIVADGHGVLALGQEVDLTGGNKHLLVDAKGATGDKALQLGAGAVLVAAQTEATKEIPVVKLDSKDEVSIDPTAQLVLSVDKYQDDGGEFLKYIVLDKEADSLWAEGNVYAADPTYRFTFADGKLVADWNKVEGIFGDGAIAAPEMYNRILQKEQNTDANKFLKDVINNYASAGSTAATKAAGAAALNAVTSLGELAAVNHGLYTVSNQMTDAVANHMSLIDNEEAGRDIWAAYIHNKEDVEGLKLGGVDANYDAKYNGVVVGADLAKSDKGNAGVALSYVDGDISGTTAGVRTRNDAKYYGVSLYGRIDGKAVSLLGDISYMHGKGDIAQTVMGQEITADAKSDAISVGVRLEKAFKLGKAGRLMPYIGARYMSISTKDYHNSLGMNYDTDKQNLFMAPVGIAYSAHIEDNGWTYKPTFEAGYVFNMGDKNVDQKVSYNGYGDTFGMDVVDNGYWFGRVGFAAEKKHMAYSLGYQYMKSNNAKNSKYMVNVTWKF